MVWAYAIGCSLDELPNESESEYCTLQNPIKKNYYYNRSLSDYEKTTDRNGFTPNKCCYLETNSVANQCVPLEESKLEEYIELLKETMDTFAEKTDHVKVSCFDLSDSSDKSEDTTSSTKTTKSSNSFQKFLKMNDKLFLIILLILFWKKKK